MNLSIYLKIFLFIKMKLFHLRDMGGNYWCIILMKASSISLKS